MVALSIWEKESFFAPADIVIAGSGLVGLWSAYYLKRRDPSLRITIVERGLIPTGASTRNAGFACFGSLTELVADAAQIGEDQMLELVEMRFKGVKRIRKTFSDSEIDYERQGGYELFTAPPSGTDSGADKGLAGVDELRSTIDRLNRPLKKITGQQKTFRLQNDKIGRFGFAGVQYLVDNRAEGQLHSGKLCQALLRLVQSMDVTVLNNIEIRGFEKMHEHLHSRPNTFATDGLPIAGLYQRFCPAIASAIGHHPGKRADPGHFADRRPPFQRGLPFR